jgi:hypothetical protein
MFNEEKTGGPAAVDRALKKNARDDAKSYEPDAQAIAKVLVRHYGDEADAVMRLALERLSDVRKTKR